MRHILWLRNRSIDRTLCEADESTNKTDSRFERGCAHRKILGVDRLARRLDVR